MSPAAARHPMRITALETFLDPERPLLVWVRIHTDDGLVGLGESFQSPDAVARVIHGTLARILLGADASQIELLWHHMFKAVHYAGYAGAEMRAISAVDIALWDLLGKRTGLPVYELLGGACRDRIPTYNTCASCGPYQDHELFHEDPARLANPQATRRLRQATRTPLVTSERLMTRFGLRPVIEADAADIVMFDIDWCGGFTEARKMAAMAATHQMPVAPHNPGGPVSNLVAAHFCASVYNLFIMESVRAFYLTWFNEALTCNLVPEQGYFPLPPGPGLGTELKPEFIDRPELIREVTSQSAGASLYSVGNPYRLGNPWQRRDAT